MNDLRVALTFDAEHRSRRLCPPGPADAIVATLAEHGVKASLFIQGRWATGYPDIARSIARVGHLVGNHSHSHAPMPALSDQGLSDDIDQAETSIRQVVGVDPPARGYRNVHWDVAVSDWEEDRTAQAVENNVIDGVLTYGDGVIVLLHTWPAPTVAALMPIVQRLRSVGCRFVTVAEVFDGR